MNGAESLVKTFVDAGVSTCFANPGTSEMHFVAALDDNPDMRCVLGLFEGVVTGAADGYARMAGVPAMLPSYALFFAKGNVFDACCSSCQLDIRLRSSFAVSLRLAIFSETPV